MQLGWIDFSRDERNRMIKALSLLRVTGAVDELGIGRIRDAYSEILFPGISTQQRRAKYFVLIPYIFAEAERQRFNSPDEVLKRVEVLEDKLGPVLRENSKGADITGIHGSQRKVEQKPSAIYWGGLKMFGIVRSATMSFSEACRAVYAKSRQNARFSALIKESQEDSGFDDATALTDNDILFAPLKAKYDFTKKASITLTKEEARYLLQKITAAKGVRGSLLEYMLRKPATWSSFACIPPEKLPAHLADSVSHAQQFANFIHGAHLRYNVLFSGKNGGDDSEYKKLYAKWAKSFPFTSLDLDAILEKVPRKDELTRRFLYNFAKAAQSGNTEKVDSLIIQREMAVKPNGRAKIGKPDYQFYTVHKRKLNYRYKTARRIIRDILQALKGERL